MSGLSINRSTVLGAVAASVAGAMYATAFEPYNIELRRISISLPRLPSAFDGFTILQLSDFHTRKIGRREKNVVRLTSALPEIDLILLTGDMVHTNLGEGPFLESVRHLRSTEGKFAVFGNSEHKNGVDPAALTASLRMAGIEPLHNQHVIIKRGGATVALAGVDDPVNELDRTKQSVAGIPHSVCKLLMMHSPDSVADAVAEEIDLVFSGHTHGGQIRLPLFGAPFTHSHFGRRMSSGYYAGKKLRNVIGIRPGVTQLYVSRGIGVSGMALRFMCRPEITFVTLRRGIPSFRVD